MNHLPELLKIIEAGLAANTQKVKSYSELLAKKLEKEGDTKSARSINKTTNGNLKKNSLNPAYANESPMPVDRDSRFDLADETFPSEQDIQIQLEPLVQEKVNEFLKFVEQSEKLSDAGVGISPSMLIYGPPGCGKTYLAQHIAAQLNLPLLTTRCDSLMSSFLGSTAKNLRKLFDHAAARPCVLFLDEFDALAKARDDQHEVGELKRVVVSLLQNIDSLPSETIMLAATNHEKLLDPAVWRRFAYQTHLHVPSSEVREKLISQYLGSFAPKKLRSTIIATDGMSGALIKQACEASMRSSIISGNSMVDEHKLLATLAHHQFGESIQSSSSQSEKIRELRSANPRLFTTRLLGEIFGISTGKVSKIINS